MTEKTAIDHARRRKAVWRIEALVFDENFARELKLRALEDNIRYGDMLMAALRMWLASGKKKETPDARLP